MLLSAGWIGFADVSPWALKGAGWRRLISGIRSFPQPETWLRSTGKTEHLPRR